MREHHWGNLEEVSITGDSGRCINQGSGDGPLSSQGPAGEPESRLVYRGH